MLKMKNKLSRKKPSKTTTAKFHERNGETHGLLRQIKPELSCRGDD